MGSEQMLVFVAMKVKTRRIRRGEDKKRRGGEKRRKERRSLWVNIPSLGI